LTCFNGGCTTVYNHSLLHWQTQHHPFVVNIKRTRKKVEREEPPQKITKLAIAAETEEDRYDTKYQVKCYAHGIENVSLQENPLETIVADIMKAPTFARQEEVKAWEQELIPCEHTLTVQQETAQSTLGSEVKCGKCDLTENLWLCLTCGHLGCGRAQYGGVGGNSHGLAHFDDSKHAVAVKLGSISADGTADIYCYQCDEERTCPDLPNLLGHFGINIKDRVRTEKTLTELQVEQNLRWDFSMTTEDGKEMKPLFGPGFTGLKNLGNSCYLASVIQCLFDIPEFAERYYRPKEQPPATNAPAEDLETQLRKMADGILSGRYSIPNSDVITTEDSPEVPYQKGLAPAMLKHLVGRGHAEFSTMRQQDSFELLLYILKLISRSQHVAPLKDPVDSFRFTMEQRLQCLNCKKVRYKIDEQENISVPVPIRRIHKDTVMDAVDSKGKETEKEEFESVTLKECLDTYTASEIVELTCPSCGSNDGFSKRSLFKTFPSVLAINARRFDIVNWVPTKCDVPVIVDDGVISFDVYLSPTHPPNEELLPEDADVARKPKFVPNEMALEMLMAMGFPKVRCEKALYATGNSDSEAAANWLFAHMEDPNIDEPVDFGNESASAGNTAVDPELVANLTSLGFTEPQARQALRETDGNIERAAEWLFSHPDAAGDIDNNGTGAGAASETPKGKTLPGSDKRPVNFQLQSIVCHKGSSIHAG
jgi:ubiquitin carboxyl-terminal hydrolase 5/13